MRCTAPIFRLARRLLLLSTLMGLPNCVFETKSPGDMAGTSISTGNPGSIKTSFKLDSLPLSFSGWVKIFASTQISIPHFQPEPLKRWVIADAKELVLGPEMLNGIADSSWPQTSHLGDSVYSFNIVFEGDSIGAIVRDLQYFGIEKKIGLGGNAILASPLERTTSFSRLERLSAFVSPERLSSLRNHYLFIYGTGYSAIGNDGYFDFPLLPKDAYKLAYIALPRKDAGHLSGQDSANIYSAATTIDTGTRITLEIGDITERIRLPEFYIRK